MLRDQRILNPQLLSALSSAGHTQLVVIADPGLPLPDGARVVDLSLVPGVPSLAQTLRAVADALVVESAVVAEECRGGSVETWVDGHLPDVPLQHVSHERFKAFLSEAHVIIRIGECTPYANVALVAGVAF